MTGTFSAELLAKIEDAVARYPETAAALLPVLHLVQNERGFISVEDERRVADLVGVPVIRVREVTTFYTMFRRRPLGRHHLQVCTNLSCALAGGARILDYLQAKLGIRPGETTEDGRFTLTTVECLGACDEAPCLMVDFDYHGHLDRDAIDQILGRLS